MSNEKWRFGFFLKSKFLKFFPRKPISCFHTQGFVRFKSSVSGLRSYFVFGHWSIVYGLWSMVFGLCGLRSPALAQEIFEKPVRIEADYLAYAFDKNMILATGHISATLGSMKINADSLQIDLNQRLLAAQGNVLIGHGAVKVETLLQEKPTPAELAKERIIVSFPLDKDTVDQSPVEITGFVEQGLIGLVNGEEVLFDAERKFTSKIPLVTGENVITVSARDTNLNADVRTLTLTVIYNPGTQTTLQGDALKFNLQTLQGTMYKVEKDVEVVNFIGEDLSVISEPVEPQTGTIKIPDLNRSTLSMVAKRVQFILGKKLEAWNVSLWVRGVRTFSIPYYTTDVEIDLPNLPFRVYALNYKSKEGTSFSSAMNYVKGKRAQGTYYLDYIQKYEKQFGKKREQKWTSRIVQHIALGKQKDLNINVNNVGEKRWSGNVNYSHYLGSSFEAAVSYNYSNGFSWGTGLLLSKRFNKSIVSVTHNYSKPLLLPNVSQSYSFSWQAYPYMLPNTHATFSWALRYALNLTRVPKKETGTFDTSFNLSRSAIILTRSLLLNTNLSMNQTMQNDRFAQTLSSSLNLSQRIKPSTFISVALLNSVTLSADEQVSDQVSSKILSFNVSTGRKRWWGVSAGNSYDLKTEKFSVWNGSLSVLLSKVIQTRVSASYDHKTNKFPGTTIYADYKLFGPGDSRRLQMNFNTKRGEYWVGLSSNI